MRSIIIILGFVCAVLGLALSILPFESIAIIPTVLAFIFGYIAFKLSVKEAKKTIFIKLIFFLTTVALALIIYRSIFDVNVVEDDIEVIEKEKQSEEEAIKELEGLEIED